MGPSLALSLFSDWSNDNNFCTNFYEGRRGPDLHWPDQCCL